MTSSTNTEMRTRLYDETAELLQAEPKQLPTVWLYDKRGSRLYDNITRLPNYYLPRREREILLARAQTIATRTRAETLIELGAGSAANTRVLLDALAGASTLQRFVPLDVSAEALQTSAHAIALAYPRIVVEPLVADFEQELNALPRSGRRLIALLGSTMGNLPPARRRVFLRSLSAGLAEGDAFLVGIDLVKDVARLHAAYNDREAVTETFIRNALVTVNSELDATFDQRRFAYEARWDEEREWMDIGLRARDAHTVSIGTLHLDASFDKGEPLRVEISSKFRRETFEHELDLAGLRVESWWTDQAHDFAVVLALPTIS